MREAVERLERSHAAAVSVNWFYCFEKHLGIYLIEQKVCISYKYYQYIP